MCPNPQPQSYKGPYYGVEDPAKVDLRIAGHEVFNVTRYSAQVGCHRVTLTEAKMLVAAMEAQR